MDLITVKNIFGPSHTMFVKIYLPLLSIFGFFGNLIVCIIFCSTTIHQTLMNSLIVSLAIADMLQFYTYFQWTEDRQGFQIQYLTLDTLLGSLGKFD